MQSIAILVTYSSTNAEVRVTPTSVFLKINLFGEEDGISHIEHARAGAFRESEGFTKDRMGY